MDTTKKEFIKMKKDARFVSDWLLRVSEYERVINKEITEWTKDDALLFYKEQEMEYIETLYRVNALLQSFINYCMTKKYVKENIFLGITISELVDTLNLELIKKKMVSRETVLSLIQMLLNPCDKFMILALFEGVRGKNGLGLLEAKLSNIKGNTLCLLDGSEIEISDKLIEIAKSSAETYEYVSKPAGGTARVYQMEYDPDKIIKTMLRKSARNNKANMEPGRVYLIRHCKLFAELIGVDVAPIDIMDAGRFDMVKTMIGEGGSVEEAIIKSENQYGKVSRMSTEVELFKKLLNM